MPRLPRFARQILFEMAAGALVGLVTLNLPIPGSISEAKATAIFAFLTLGRTAIRAGSAAFTTAVPTIVRALRSKLLPEDTTYPPTAGPEDL